MIWITIIVPVIAALVLIIFFGRLTKWWEAIGMILISLLIVAGFNAAFVGYRTASTEYWGGHITKVYHSEHWDEWITQTCTRSYACGTDTDSKGNTTTRYCTETYDCSYRDDHPEYWEAYGNNGESFRISQNEYKKLVRQFGTGENFVEMNRDYYRIDGDAYSCNFDGTIQKAEIISSQHTYENRIKVSNSILRVDKPNPKVWKQLDLHDYPQLSDRYQAAVIGYKGKDSAYLDRQFQLVNGMLGKKHQVRAFLVVFYDKPMEAGVQQRAYWEGGNKNEITITVGLNSRTGKIDWCYAYSWSERPVLEQNIQTFVMNMKDKPNFTALAHYVYERIPSDWQRRHFKEFAYLTVLPNGTQLTWMWIVIIIVNCGMVYWILINEFQNENSDTDALNDAFTEMKYRIQNWYNGTVMVRQKIKSLFVK